MPSYITIDDLIAALMRAREESPIGGDTVIHLWRDEEEYHPNNTNTKEYTMAETGQAAEAVQELVEALAPLGDQASAAVETAAQAAQHAALVEGLILLGFSVFVFALGQFTFFYGRWYARREEASPTKGLDMNASEIRTYTMILSLLIHIIAAFSLAMGLHRVLAPEWYGIKNLLEALPAIIGVW